TSPPAPAHRSASRWRRAGSGSRSERCTAAWAEPEQSYPEAREPRRSQPETSCGLLSAFSGLGRLARHRSARAGPSVADCTCPLDDHFTLRESNGAVDALGTRLGGPTGG